VLGYAANMLIMNTTSLGIRTSLLELRNTGKTPLLIYDAKLSQIHGQPRSCGIGIVDH
jgi:hypothetical protein